MSISASGPIIAIIGAGFSGTLLALHVLRQCPANVRVCLIERNARFGRGQAYATGNPGHLLNVPAGRMSAFQDQPDDFVVWLRQTIDANVQEGPPTASSFVPRRQFGDYVRSLLNEEMKRPNVRDRLELLRGDVVALEATRSGLTLQLDRGRVLEATIAVLATGNLPPEPPALADAAFYDTPFYRPDPWALDTLDDLDPNVSVLLIGTGLTMVDTVISLLDQRHKGPIHALSRRGLLPRRHASFTPDHRLAGPYPTTITALLRFLRREAARIEAAGGSWRQVVDGLRPLTQDLWQAMALAERARFLRHLRPWWDVHRHRMPPQVADAIETARSSGQLHVHRGRITAFDPHDHGVDVCWRPRGATAPETLFVSRVVNCAGPACDYDRISDPLPCALLRDGLVRPDPLRLGLDVTANCAVRDRSGAVSRCLSPSAPSHTGPSGRSRRFRTFGGSVRCWPATWRRYSRRAERVGEPHGSPRSGHSQR